MLGWHHDAVLAYGDPDTGTALSHAEALTKPVLAAEVHVRTPGDWDPEESSGTQTLRGPGPEPASGPNPQTCWHQNLTKAT